MANQTEVDGGGIKALMGRTYFRRLFIGQSISGLGDWVATFAFISLVYSLTGSTSGVAVVLILRLIPPLFAAPLGGLFADRLSRRSIMIACDLSRAALIVLVPFVDIWLVYAIALVHELISLFFLPARDASVPELAGKASLEQANGLMMASSYGSLPVAGGLFGLLRKANNILPAHFPLAGTINHQPTSLAFFVDGLSFLVSAWFIYKIRLEYKARRHATENTALADLKEGLKIFFSNQLLRALAYAMLVAMFGGGVLFAVGIAYVHKTLHANDTMFGWLAALWGVGMALGLPLIRFLVSHRSRIAVLATAVFVCGGLLIAMSLLSTTLLALILAVPFGAAFSLALMLAISLAQSAVSAERRGRMMGAVQMLYRLGLGGGALAMGFVAHSVKSVDLVEHMDGNQLGLFISGLFILTGAIAAIRCVRHTPA